jgi:predicted nucleotide-binding protein
MAGMERFTKKARRVLSFAYQETERADHPTIGPEHLLLGLMDEEGGVGGLVLRELGMTVARVREVIYEVSTSSPNFDPNRVELGVQTQQVLENAVDEARRLGHHYIGTEHILLGLVRVESTATQVLRRLGVTEEQILRLTQRVLGELNESPASSKIETSESLPPKKTNQVLLVQGRDMEASQTVTSYIESLGLQVVTFNQQSDRQLFSFATEVVFAVVLLTADDLVVSKSESQITKFHASQNVIYELGYFRGKLGHKRVCALFKSDPEMNVELPTESFRVTYVPLDSTGKWQLMLAKKMQEAGIIVNSGNI